MGNAKVNVAVKLSLMDTCSGHKTFLDDTDINLDKEQYNRIQVSYKSKKFKDMNDDDSLADICKFIADYYGFEYIEDKEETQKVVIGYPIEISSNLNFEDLPCVQVEESDNHTESFDLEYEAETKNNSLFHQKNWLSLMRRLIMFLITSMR